MRVRHDWERLPLTAILLVLVAVGAAPRCARYRVQNAGSRTRAARALGVDQPRHNITLDLSGLPVGVRGCEQSDRNPEVHLHALEDPHFVATARIERIWLLDRGVPTNKPRSATSVRAPPLSLPTRSSTKTILL